MGVECSIDGLALTSISHVPHVSSTMKSQPYISNEPLRWCTESTTVFIAATTMRRIAGCILRSHLPAPPSPLAKNALKSSTWKKPYVLESSLGA